jgi:hypothetical protein
MLSAIVALSLAAVVVFLPYPAPTLAPAAVENAAATGLSNPVTNVLMAFRAMDTLLEKVVLLLAQVEGEPGRLRSRRATASVDQVRAAPHQSPRQWTGLQNAKRAGTSQLALSAIVVATEEANLPMSPQRLRKLLQ